MSIFLSIFFEPTSFDDKVLLWLCGMCYVSVKYVSNWSKHCKEVKKQILDYSLLLSNSDWVARALITRRW